MPWVPLPSNFRHGINLGGAYGNHVARWTIDPGATWKNSNPNLPGHPTGSGHDVNWPTRLNALFDLNDFEVLYGRGDQFDHVIFNIDPRTFGAHEETGELTYDYVDLHPVSAIWQALANDIQAAREAGLAVVIAMHATVASADHANDIQKLFAGSLEEGMNGTRPYPGPYRVTLFTRGREGHQKPLDLNHPFPTFWRKFVQKLSTYTTLDSDIAFRVGGESIVMSANQFDLSCAPYVPGLQWEEQLEPGSTSEYMLNGVQFGKWINHALKDYRQLELLAAVAIWSLPDTHNCRIIVAPGQPWPSEHGRNRPLQTLGSLPGGSTWIYSPYLPVELANAGLLETNLAYKFIYGLHAYHPWWYTHPQNRFYNGQLRSPYDIKYQGLTDSYEQSWIGPAPAQNPTTGQFPQYEPDYKYYDYVARAFTNPRQETRNLAALDDPSIPPSTLVAWRTQWNSPPMMATEFGVERRGLEEMQFVRGNGPDGLDLQLLGTHDVQRAQWHWDVRTFFEGQGIGWSVWDIFSGWNTMNGYLDFKETSGVWNFHPPRYQPMDNRNYQETDHPAFFPQMWKALFGTERPNANP